jgi:hypothetical protein
VNKGRITIIVLFGILSVVLIAYFILNSEKRYQWYESYNTNSDQPYGTKFIKQLLEDYRPGSKLIINKRKSLKHLLDSTAPARNTDYIFIGQSLHVDEGDIQALLSFIAEGNDAFIASLEMPATLVYRIYSIDECDAPLTFDPHEEKNVTLNFFHDSLRSENGFQYAYRYHTEDHPYTWSAVNEGSFCDSTTAITPLGYHEPNRVNFIRIAHGNGYLYLHSNPIVFTNYFLIEPSRLDYVAGVLSHLRGRNIIWDDYSKVPYLGNNNAYDSPLYYILQQPSLKYAWWLMLLSVLLYVMFVSKRTQRVIPVLEPKTNTSLEFVRLISSLHFQNGSHLDMAKKKMKYFLYFIRSKYGIHEQTFSEASIAKLAEKSKVNLMDVKAIFSQYDIIERNAHHNNIDAGRLAGLYYSIENFYKQCK